jgi:hypothetical protein
MRPGQNSKRMRGRNRGKGPNPLNRSLESNGPDVKIRGTAQHIAEKYLQLARDATASGDRITAENYMQHAEHYFRMLAAAQAQFAPHLPAYVRPDEQQYDEDDEFEEGDAPLPAEGQQAAPPPPFAGNGGGYGGGQRDQREFRPRERDRPFDRRHEGRDRGPPQERPEFGEQPSVDFPARRDERPYGDRPPRGEFQDRGPRHERGARSERAPRPEPEPPEGEQAPAADASPSADAAPDFPGEPREQGLPSFLTRGRRRGRPPYRARGESEDGGDAAASPESPGDQAPPTRAN